MAATPPPTTGPPPTANDDALSEISQQDTMTGPVMTRAGIEARPRLALMTIVGGFWGFTIGSYLGGKQTAYQYLAENAHKLPTTVRGWYFYHKTKNYKVMLGGIKRGVRMGIPTAAICLAYGGMEAALDDARKEADMFNSIAAGMGTGVLFSAMRLYCGIVTGGLNDLHRVVSGDTPSYVNWLKGTASESQTSSSTA